MSSHLIWDENDEEKPWESDKFTAMDELAYEAGIDTAPSKGPDYDKLFLERLEKNEYLQSKEGRLAKTSLIAEHMDYTEVKKGKLIDDEGKKTRDPIDSRSAANTKGSFLQSATNNNISDDDDDLFRDDDDDDDFQRQLEQLKKERINELKKQAEINKSSLHSHEKQQIDALSRQSTLPVANGVKEIIPEEYQNEIIEASKSCTVLMLVYKQNNRASEILLSCLNQLQRRKREIKCCVILYSSALLHVPEQHCPILMCYQKEKVVGSFAKLDHFRGSTTTALDVEWKLAECGIIETELQEDPREAAMFDKK
jgi:hypothetical protein